jgi:hypothetical protein
MSEEQTTALSQRLDALEAKLDAVYQSVEKTRMYFRVAMWVTIGAVVLPMLGLVFVIPAFLNSYLGALDGLL